MSLTKIFVGGILLFLLLMFMLNPEHTLTRIATVLDSFGSGVLERANRDPDRTSAVVVVIVLAFVLWAIAKAKPWGGGKSGGKGD